MRVSVCLRAILIPEYLDFHSGCSAPRSRIAGIYSGISRTNAPFVENNRTIILPGDTRRPTTSELPDVDAKLEAWRMKMLYKFSLFKIWYGCCNYKFLFLNMWCRFQWEKLSDFSAFLSNLHWIQESRVFPACWILIGFQARQPRQQYARGLLDCNWLTDMPIIIPVTIHFP